MTLIEELQTIYFEQYSADEITQKLKEAAQIGKNQIEVFGVIPEGLLKKWGLVVESIGWAKNDEYEDYKYIISFPLH